MTQFSLIKRRRYPSARLQTRRMKSTPSKIEVELVTKGL